MGTSLNSILAPADQLRDLLFTPRLIYFCAFFAYYGLKNGISLTHGGMRKGTIAKIYGGFYLLVCLLSLWSFPSDIQKVLAISSSDMQNALFFIEPFQLGFVYIGISAFIFIFTEWLIRYGRKKVSAKSRKLHRIQDRRNFLNWMIALPLATGIQTLIGLPYWVNVGIFVFFTYFAPFTSPKKLMKTMRLPDEGHQGVKSSPSTDNVG
ncbi:MAG: hypothetical protein JNM55_10215 [Anaerolineales bacterium]|nr:hypothetical protein [Anaerolineales bacterium]